MKTYHMTQECIIKRTISVDIDAESMEEIPAKIRQGKYHIKKQFDSLPEFVSATVVVETSTKKKKNR